MNNDTIGGYRVRFERRRYGYTTYTWAEYLTSDGSWCSLGDPWPQIRVSRSDILSSIRCMEDERDPIDGRKSEDSVNDA